MNLNIKQVIAIVIAVLGVLMISQSQLETLVGVAAAKNITSLSALINSVLGSVMAVLTSQGSTVKDVLNMKGVEKIDVNAQANQTLSAIAVDPMQDKISPTPAAQTAVQATAKGTS